MEISWIAVLLAGGLSFLSPCVLPLVPPYLCYMAGVSIEDLRNGHIAEARDSSYGAFYRMRVGGMAVAFVLGFSTVFVILGATSSGLGQFLLRWQEEMAIAAGVIIILMGLHFLGFFRLALLFREWRLQPHTFSPGPLGAFVMGLAFAFGWTPCIGPILAPILALAATKATLWQGAGLLAVYSLGLGIPLVLSAFFSQRFMRFLVRFRVHFGLVEKLIGIFLILAGGAFISGQMQIMSFWLLETFPTLQQLG